MRQSSSNIVMDSEDIIHKLIAKIDKGLPEIRVRAIATLHTKITVGLLSVELLPTFVLLPRACMNWINDNTKKSDSLFKVLVIIQLLTRSQSGLLLLNQYEALEFFEELRLFIIANERNAQQILALLEEIVKALLPNGRTLEQASKAIVNAVQDTKEQTEKTPNKSRNGYKQGRGHEKAEIELTWRVPKDPLDSRTDEKLYKLLIELRHGRKQLQLSALNEIGKIVKYYGDKSFRYKTDLINELGQYVQCKLYEHVCCGIIEDLLEGLVKREGKMLSVVSVEKGAFSTLELQLVPIDINRFIFESVFSCGVYAKLIQYCTHRQSRKQQFTQKQISLQNWLLHLQYKFQYKPWLDLFTLSCNCQTTQINDDILSQTIQFYSEYYPECRQLLIDSFTSGQISQQYSLDKFPVLKRHSRQKQSFTSFKHIQQYLTDIYDINDNLQSLSQIITNLNLGISGIMYNSLPNNNLKIYLECMLVLTIATARQDPLMSYYPTITNIVITIASTSARVALYEQLLALCNSFDKINYLSKCYIRGEVMMMLVADRVWHCRMLELALEEESCLGNWLEITKKLMLTVTDTHIMQQFVTIYFGLCHHANQKILSLSKLIFSKIGKKFRVKTTLMQLYSADDNQRIQGFDKLLHCPTDLLGSSTLPSTTTSRISTITDPPQKKLNISPQAISNYIKIVFNSSLDRQIRLSGINQLIEALARVKPNQQIVNISIMLYEQLITMLSNPSSLQLNMLPFLLRLFAIVKRIYQNSNDNVVLPLNFSCQVLIELFTMGNLGHTTANEQARRCLLELIYQQCFQSPFTNKRQMHFTMLLFPHVQIGRMEVSKPKVLEIVPTTECHQDNKSVVKSVIRRYEDSKQFKNYIQQIVINNNNNRKIQLGTFCSDLIQKQLGIALHNPKQPHNLSLISYFLNFCLQHHHVIPSTLSQTSINLLNNLLLRQNQSQPYICEQISKIIIMLGVKRNKQLPSIIVAAGDYDYHKYYLLLHMPILELELVENVVKKIGVSSQSKLLIIVIRVFIKSGLLLENLSEYTRLQFMSTLLKCVRVQDDQLLRRSALTCVLEIIRVQTNYAIINDQLSLLSSVVGDLLQLQFPISTFCLLLQVLRYLINYAEDEDEGRLLKPIICQLLKLVQYVKNNTHYDEDKGKDKDVLVDCAVFALLNTIMCSQLKGCLEGVEITDVAIGLLQECMEGQQLVDMDLLLVTVLAQFLLLQCLKDQELDKYLLTSTDLLKIVVQLVSNNYEGISEQIHQNMLEQIGSLIHFLAQEEQLFVYKLGQLLSTADRPQCVFELFVKQLEVASIQYLKMYAWLASIWPKGRSNLDQSAIGKMATQKYINRGLIMQMRSIIAISTTAKIKLANSQQFQDHLRATTQLIEARTVREIRQNKAIQSRSKPASPRPTVNIAQQDGAALASVQNTLKLFVALFAPSDTRVPPQQLTKQAMKKIYYMVQKLYVFVGYYPSLQRQFSRMLANICRSSLFRNFFGIQLGECNSAMVDDLLTIVASCQTVTTTVKRAFMFLSALVQQQSVRSMIYKGRIIEDLNMRLIKDEQRRQQDPRRYDSSALSLLNEIIQLYTSLSVHKDGSMKLLSDKRILQCLLVHLSGQKSAVVEQKIVILLANLACYKHNKTMMMSNRELHKIALGLLSQHVSYAEQLVILVYNLIYKNAAGVKLYRRKQVIEIVEAIEVTDKSKQVMEALLQVLHAEDNVG